MYIHTYMRLSGLLNFIFYVLLNSHIYIEIDVWIEIDSLVILLLEYCTAQFTHNMTKLNNIEKENETNWSLDFLSTKSPALYSGHRTRIPQRECSNIKRGKDIIVCVCARVLWIFVVFENKQFCIDHFDSVWSWVIFFF